GEHKYFAEPLPKTIQELRSGFYAPLASIANRWMEKLGSEERYPNTLNDFLTMCQKRGQSKPTPLLLHYEAGGYNCLHQDLYGEVAFPLQLTCFLSEPGRDYSGGEFLLLEQRPRAQSKGEAITARQGDIMIFTNRFVPTQRDLVRSCRVSFLSSAWLLATGLLRRLGNVRRIIVALVAIWARELSVMLNHLSQEG